MKDLEAQMRKVDLRPENDIINANAHPTIHTEQRDKAVTKDTEAFKRLLQQLGSQNISHPGTESSYPMNANVSVARSGQSSNTQDRQQYIIQVQENQTKEDELQLYQQQRSKKIDTAPQRHIEMISQNQMHPVLPPGIHDSNISGLLPLQAHKRMEIQQLLQGMLFIINYYIC